MTDEDILDAARASILAHGWSRTTASDIARRAGISRMTLYRRWADMGALLGDLLTREWLGTLAGVRGLQSSTPEGIAGAVVTAVRALRRNELLARIIELDPQLLLPYLLERPGRSQALVIDALATTIRRGQRTGGLRRGRPEAMARAVVLAAHGFTLSAGTMSGDGAGGGDPARFDRELRTMVAGYLRP